MARHHDIINTLLDRLGISAKRIETCLEEQAGLREAHLRYEELQDHISHLKDEMLNSIAFIDEDWFGGDDLARLEEKTGVVLNHKKELNKMPLWKAMLKLLNVTGELQVFELHNHLKEIGFDISRPAIESALTTHKTRFVVRRDGREKYVRAKKT